MDFFRLRVTEIYRETKQAKSIVFAIPPTLAKTFHWLAGQYVDVRLNIGGKNITRSYSISNDGKSAGLRITVKGLYKGLASNYLVKKLKVGQELEVSRPRGRFHLPQHINDQLIRSSHYVFFAAGSGITPIFAMICQLLQQDNQSKISLFYANSQLKNTIFLKALHVLTNQYPHRFIVSYCLSSTSFFDSLKPWHKGRADGSVIRQFLSDQGIALHLSDDSSANFYLCGPAGFMRMASQTLVQANIPASKIHQESYGGGGTKNTVVSGVKSELVVDENDVQNTIAVNANETLLAAMLRQNIDAPYSCEEGVCGNCQCQLLAGKVAMLDNLFLTNEEQAKGLILSCQAIAQTSKVKISL